MTVTPQLPEVSCCYADADALSLNELEKYQ
jgi:hypothetical protein